MTFRLPTRGHRSGGGSRLWTATVTVTTVAMVAALLAGAQIRAAVRADGTTPPAISNTVWGWGRNDRLQTGTPSPLPWSPTPTPVDGVIDVRTVAAGSAHGLAIKADGSAWAWGAKGSGSTGFEKGHSKPCYSNSLTVGSLCPDDQEGAAAPVGIYGPPPTGISALAAGGVGAVASPSGRAATAHSLALADDGTVLAFGANERGQLGSIPQPTDPRTVPHASATQPLVVGWPLPLRVPGLAGVSGIAAGGGHSLARRADGTVWAWGRNDHGQLGDATTVDHTAPAQVTSITAATAIAGGTFHSLAVAGGRVWAWGANDRGQLGDGTTTDRSGPAQVPNLTDVVAVAGGTSFSLALRSDGSVWAWGANESGQLGNGSTTAAPAPAEVSFPAGVVITSLAAGGAHVLAVDSDRSVWAWGANDRGQLGDGTTTRATRPIRLPGLAGVTQVAAGTDFSLAVSDVSQVAVLSVAPVVGPSIGGTRVVVKGHGFAGATVVRFGETTATQFRVDSDQQITVVAPALRDGSPATVAVTVTSPKGVAPVDRLNRYHYAPGSWGTVSRSPANNAYAIGLLGGPRCGARCGQVLVRINLQPNLYDPATDRWSPLGTIPSAINDDQLAFRFLDGPDCAADCGMYVVAGGSHSGLYDPGSDTWTDLGADPLQPHTLNLLGPTAILRGPSCSPNCGKVLFTVNKIGSTNTRSELFDPASNTWTEVAGPTAVTHQWASATVLDGPRCGADCGKVLLAGGLTATAELFDPATLSWSAVAAPMTSVRRQHTATLLASPRCGDDCGKVLFIGGADAPTSAELYDPADRSFAPLPTQPIGAHFGHSATVMSGSDCGSTCGMILVTGGNYDTPPQGELYDPSTRAWDLARDAGPLGPNAVPVPDGRVFVFGTPAPNVFYPDKLRPRPVLAATSPTTFPSGTAVTVTLTGEGLSRPGTKVTLDGSLPLLTPFVSNEEIDVVVPPSPRGSSTITVDEPGAPPLSTTVMPSGAPGGAWADAPSTKTMSACAPSAVPVPPDDRSGGMAHAETLNSCTPRYSHTATRLTGPMCRESPLGQRPSWCDEVLVAGGATSPFYFNVLDVGTRPCPCPWSVAASAELFDPVTGGWTHTGSMATARFRHDAALLDGPECRNGNPSVSLGVRYPPWCGNVLVVGGETTHDLATNTAELYDPSTGLWRPTGPMAAPRLALTATALADGSVLATGGADEEDNTHTSLPTAEVYAPAAGVWRPTGPMTDAREQHAATALPDGRVVVVGGVQLVDSGVKVPISGKSLVPGNVLSSVEVWDKTTGLWAHHDGTVRRWDATATVLDGPPCGGAAPPSYCGKVLIAGGKDSAGGQANADLFDPNAKSDALAFTPSLMVRARSGHTATLLPNGRVLVVGSGDRLPDQRPGSDATDVSEDYDPASNRWQETGRAMNPVGGHTATLLPDGRVLVAGGYYRWFSFAYLNLPCTCVETSQLYTPVPVVRSLGAARGPVDGGTSVHVDGSGFAGVSAVRFGGVPATSFSVESPTSMTVVTPPHAKGVVPLEVVNAGGTSATLPPDPTAQFTFVGPPGRIGRLDATAESETTVRLDFAAPDDGTVVTPARRYEVKQSTTPIVTDADFVAAAPVCPAGVCTGLTPAQIGDHLVLRITDLTPGTTYHYAVRALNDLGDGGPLSPDAAVRTTGTEPLPPITGCAAITPAAGEIAYRAGYSLIALPAGTAFAGDSPLYTWFDQGNGGAYTSATGPGGLDTGHGYWSWLRCASAVTPAVGVAHARTTLAAYHASMVGNPSGLTSATVTGHDYAATWDPTLDGGAGGYVLSGYREPQPLRAGEGAWVFSYTSTTIDVGT